MLVHGEAAPPLDEAGFAKLHAQLKPPADEARALAVVEKKPAYMLGRSGNPLGSV